MSVFYGGGYKGVPSYKGTTIPYGNYSIESNGLIWHIDPLYGFDSDEFINLVNPGGLKAPLGGTYSVSGGVCRLTNSNSNKDLNVSFLQFPTLTNFKTICMWYYVHSTPSSTRYLLDARTGSSNGYIWSGGVGTDWSNGYYYKNDERSVLPITWAGMEDTVTWRMITIIIPQTTDSLMMFSRYTGAEGYNVSFGPIMIYNTILTQPQIVKNWISYKDRYEYFAGP